MSERYPRRTFVVTGTAAGAAIVWGAAHPFADSDIGQTAQAADGPSGTTGGTGPTGTVTPSPTSTGGTGNTGGSGGKKKERLHVKSSKLHVKHNTVTVALSFTGPKALKATVKLQAISHGKLIAIGHAHFHVAKGGGTRHVKVHLNAKGRTLVAKFAHLSGRLSVTGHGAVAAHKHVSIKS